MIRASTFGSCIKAQIAGELGFEPAQPPQKTQEIFDRGREHEQQNLTVLAERGITIIDQQREVCLHTPWFEIIGHVDGIVNRGDETLIWESKSPNSWKKFETAYKTSTWVDPLMEQYAWQISIYMHALQLPAWVTCVEGHTLRHFTIRTPPRTLQQIHERAEIISTHVRQGRLPDGCSTVNYPCPFFYLHEEEITVTDDAETSSLAAEYLDLLNTEKEITARKKEITARLSEICEQKITVTNQGFRVTFHPRRLPDRYDIERMINDGIPVDRYRLPERTVTQIKITRKEENAAQQ